ncbi:hypothetical protein VNO80_06517 [Phaseolus coccineus]|uniref:Uncharacterized protein n=1 Tax=Phaseolus coccineus TaxID=3886 RepID=A0AAN9NIH6_PHACN
MGLLQRLIAAIHSSTTSPKKLLLIPCSIFFSKTPELQHPFTSPATGTAAEGTLLNHQIGITSPTSLGPHQNCTFKNNQHPLHTGFHSPAYLDRYGLLLASTPYSCAKA